MTTIKLRCDGQNATAWADGPLVEGTANIPVEIILDGYDDYAPKLVAKCGTETRDMVISYEDGGMRSEVPHECLRAGQELKIGIDAFSQEGSGRMPSMWAKVGKVEPSPAGEEPQHSVPPTPELVDQILTQAGRAERMAQQVRDDAAAGLFNGKPALIDPVTGNWLLWVNDAYVDSGYPSRGEGGDVDPEQLREAIEAYMREHPINLPLASNTNFGIAKFSGNGFAFGSDGQVILQSPTAANIASRLDNRAVTLNKLDDCVKAAMADGKGATWTAEEQAAAQQRLGILSVEEVLF